MKKSRILTLLLTLGLFASISPVVANANLLETENDDFGVFSTTPSKEELERQKQYQLDTPLAWEIDLEGKKKYVPYIVPNKESGIGTNSWSDSNYTYVFNGWTLNSTKIDKKRFFVSRVTVENRSTGTLPLKYVQQESVTTKWEVGANIEAEAEFKVKFLASLNAKLGGSYNYSKTTYSSTTVEAGPKNIPAGYSASYTKYRAGGYGAGQAEWKKYPKGSSSWIGMYYTGESGWAVNENDVTIEYSETKL
ncbi:MULTISPECIES: hypothetical protein [Paenibacillus]|jgi:hypothetical protein|uniref:hypothetical protein n=1 Tax=Paenibacillus TaxID=44249 RepID=UPI00048B39D5|nr:MULTISPECIES: hypothetical protein [Paenibacillus]MEC2346710.1 hypothetical protein [Paenibacillus barengoltzii]SMF63964.1 hypothetical protein SAMN02744102_04316 [Paenibacillus barengoltzii]